MDHGLDPGFNPPRPAIPVSFGHEGKYCENCGATFAPFQAGDDRPAVHDGAADTVDCPWPRTHGSYLHYAYWYYGINRAARNLGYYHPRSGRWIGVEMGVDHPDPCPRWPLPPWPNYLFTPWGPSKLPDRFPEGGFYAADGEWLSIITGARQPPPDVGPLTLWQLGRWRRSNMGCPWSVFVNEDEEDKDASGGPPSHRRLCRVCVWLWQERHPERNIQRPGQSSQPATPPPPPPPPVPRDQYPRARFRIMNQTQLYWEVERLNGTPAFREWRRQGGSIWSDTWGQPLSHEEQAWENFEIRQAKIRAANQRAADRRRAEYRAQQLAAPTDSGISVSTPAGNGVESQQQQ
ncbi:hypothetical protein KJ359_001496 [Pestalotiopsis sp. 9143b]|nr:hypothetical protein KJ359_001496 [Pestalotiopsis sp. 9143b]